MSVLMGAQRVVDRVEALDEGLVRRLQALERGVEDLARGGEAAQGGLRDQIAALTQEVRHVARRQEEILAYVAARLNRMMNAQSAYLGDHVALTFLESGYRIYVDTRDVGIGSHLLSYGVWEQQYVALFQRLLRPGQRVVDLGANHGVYTLLAAAAVGPTGRVDAFEANPHLAVLTYNSVRINGFGDRTQVHSVAVGDAAGTATLVFDTAWSGGGNIRQGGAGRAGTRVEIVRLDDALPDPARPVDMIKMDVEGAEGRALRGMRQVLARSPDLRIMMEFSPPMLADAGTPAREVAAMLDGLGFRAWEIGLDSSIAPIGWDALGRPSEEVRNVLVSRQDPA